MAHQVYESCVIILYIMVCIRAAVFEDRPEEYPMDTHLFSSYRDTPLNESISPYTSNYTTLLFLEDGRLVVGARNVILSLNVTGQEFHVLKVKSWIPAASMKQDTCISSDVPKEDCYNFIKMLSLSGDKLLCCGTNSYYPECSWRNVTNLEEISDSFYGKGFVPFLPDSKSTYLFSGDGRFFSGVETEFGGYGRTVLATDFDDENKVLKVRKVFKSDLFLNDPVFHRMFSIGDYIYFFFDEVARECVNCDSVRYSRVGRLCKKDDGGTGSFFWNNFLTFQKARLNCSSGGLYPFYYNTLRDIDWDAERQIFHGVFTSERSQSFHISAVCSYSLKEIENAFSGKFRVKEMKKNVWRDKQNPGHIRECRIKKMSSTPESGRIQGNMLSRSDLIEHHQFVLASNVVQPQFNVTSFNMTNIRFLKVLIVAFDTNPGQITEVWYVATDRGTILKLSKIPSSVYKMCIVEEYSIFQDGKTEIPLEMKLSPNKEFIVIGSDTKITKLYLLRCDIYKNKGSCLEAQDPLCGWSTKQGRCISWNKRDARDWQQDIKSCPQRKAHWSDWSSWITCEQNNGNLCRCRRRKCVFARDRYQCDGSDIQLENCTVTQLDAKEKKAWIKEGVVHGKWSRWSEWSMCYRGFRNRSRACNEPPAKNGGMKCRENSKDYVLCEPERFDGNVTYLWTSWNRVRGPERKVRRYKLSCTSKAVVMKSLQIDIEDTETKNCTKELCIDPVQKPQQVLTAWSDWLSCNSSIDKIRTRHLCEIDNSNRSTWLCKQQNIERNYTSIISSVPACVPGSTIATTTTYSSASQSNSCGAVTTTVNTVKNSERTKTLTSSVGSNVSSVNVNEHTRHSRKSTSTESPSGGKTTTTSVSASGSTSTRPRATDIKPTSTMEAVCVTTVISTIAGHQNPGTAKTVTEFMETDITEGPPLFQWSSCACDHEVALSDKVLGIQHRSRLVNEALVNEYRTCVCSEVVNTAYTDNPNMADMEALGKDEDDGRFSLKMLITIVTVCCVICIILTAILLIIFYHKYPPSRKIDNNNKSNGTSTDHRETSQGV